MDVALYEAVFAMMESMLPEYGMGGYVRERSGAALPGIVPSNTYPCADGKYVVIGANADSIFKRMMRAIGRIYSIADIVADMHYQACGMVERHKLGDAEVLLPGIVPKLSRTPGATRWIGPTLGEHTGEVLARLGYTEGEIEALRKRGVVG